MAIAASGIQGQLLNIGATPLQMSGNVIPLGNGVTIRALVANSTNKVYVGQQKTTSAPAWAINTAYVAGNQVKLGGSVYQCTTPGTSAGSGGPTGTAPAITDGTVVWAYLYNYAVSSTNGFELSSGESHLFQCNNASVLYVVGSTTALGVCFDGS